MSGMVTVTGRDELGRIIDVRLTTAADVAPPGPETVSSGGATQTLRLVEYDFAHNDAFVNDDYETFHTVENDGYVIYSAFIPTVPWAGAGTPQMSWEAVKNGSLTFLQADDIEAGGQEGREFIPTSRYVVPVNAGDTLGVGVWPSGGSLSAGEAKLVVLIAEPT